MAQIIKAKLLEPAPSGSDGKKLRSMGITQVKPDDLVTLAELFDNSTIRREINRRYLLDEIRAPLRKTGSAGR